MQPPVEFQDKSDYKHKMSELLELNVDETVALTVDMQRDYLDPTCATMPLADDIREELLERTSTFLQGCRDLGVPVVHTYVQRRPIEADRGITHSTVYGFLSQQAKISQNPLAPARAALDRVAGTPNAELPDVLVGDDDFHMTTKRSNDSFHQTDLDTILGRFLQPKSLLICGINTDTCVFATVFGAAHRHYRPVVVSDCVGSMRGADNHWMALELMARSMAWVMPSTEVLERLKASR